MLVILRSPIEALQGWGTIATGNYYHGNYHPELTTIWHFEGRSVMQNVLL